MEILNPRLHPWIKILRHTTETSYNVDMDNPKAATQYHETANASYRQVLLSFYLKQKQVFHQVLLSYKKGCLQPMCQLIVTSTINMKL
jgi:hypothetical protein